MPSQRWCGDRQRGCSAHRSAPWPAAAQCAQPRSSAASAQSGTPSHARRDSASLRRPPLQSEFKQIVLLQNSFIKLDIRECGLRDVYQVQVRRSQVRSSQGIVRSRSARAIYRAGALRSPRGRRGSRPGTASPAAHPSIAVVAFDTRSPADKQKVICGHVTCY